MTIDQFNNTGFTGGMQVVYQGETYDLISVDFEEKLIAINEYGDDEQEPSWKRCENVELCVPQYQVIGTAEMVELTPSELEELEVAKRTKELLNK